MRGKSSNRNRPRNDRYQNQLAKISDNYNYNLYVEESRGMLKQEHGQYKNANQNFHLIRDKK